MRWTTNSPQLLLCLALCDGKAPTAPLSTTYHSSEQCKGCTPAVRRKPVPKPSRPRLSKPYPCRRPSRLRGPPSFRPARRRTRSNSSKVALGVLHSPAASSSRSHHTQSPERTLGRPSSMEQGTSPASRASAASSAFTTGSPVSAARSRLKQAALTVVSQLKPPTSKASAQWDLLVRVATAQKLARQASKSASDVEMRIAADAEIGSERLKVSTVAETAEQPPVAMTIAESKHDAAASTSSFQWSGHSGRSPASSQWPESDVEEPAVTKVLSLTLPSQAAADRAAQLAAGRARRSAVGSGPLPIPASARWMLRHKLVSAEARALAMLRSDGPTTPCTIPDEQASPQPRGVPLYSAPAPWATSASPATTSLFSPDVVIRPAAQSLASQSWSDSTDMSSPLTSEPLEGGLAAQADERAIPLPGRQVRLEPPPAERPNRAQRQRGTYAVVRLPRKDTAATGLAASAGAPPHDVEGPSSAQAADDSSSTSAESDDDQGATPGMRPRQDRGRHQSQPKNACNSIPRADLHSTTVATVPPASEPRTLITRADRALQNDPSATTLGEGLPQGEGGAKDEAFAANQLGSALGACVKSVKTRVRANAGHPEWRLVVGDGRRAAAVAVKAAGMRVQLFARCSELQARMMGWKGKLSKPGDEVTLPLQLYVDASTRARVIKADPCQ